MHYFTKKPSGQKVIIFLTKFVFRFVVKHLQLQILSCHGLTYPFSMFGKCLFQHFIFQHFLLGVKETENCSKILNLEKTFICTALLTSKFR